MIKGIRRLGKAKLKYRFDITVHSATLTPGAKWKNAPLRVVWTRGPRTAATEDGEFVTNSGIVEWQAKLCMLATLYQSGSGAQAEEKRYRLALMANDTGGEGGEGGEKGKKKGKGKGKGKLKTLAATQIDLAEYATVSSKPVTKTIPLKTKSKRVAAAGLTLTISAVCLSGNDDDDDGEGDDDDSADSISIGSDLGSISSLSSMSGDDEDASVGSSGVGISSSSGGSSNPRLRSVQRAPPPQRRRAPSLRSSRMRGGGKGDDSKDKQEVESVPAVSSAVPDVPAGPGEVKGGAGGAKEVRYLQKMLQQQLSDAWKEKQIQEETIEELQLEVEEKSTIVVQYKTQLDAADARIAELEADLAAAGGVTTGSSGAAASPAAADTGATKEELLELLNDSMAKIKSLKTKNKARKMEIVSLETRLAAAELSLERENTRANLAPPPSLPTSLAYVLESATPDRVVLRTPGGRTLSVGIEEEVPGYGRVQSIDENKMEAKTTSGRVLRASSVSSDTGAAAAVAAVSSPGRSPVLPKSGSSGSVKDRRAFRQLTEDYNEAQEKIVGLEKQIGLLGNETKALKQLVSLYAPEEVRSPARVLPGEEADDETLTEEGVRIRALETMLELAVADAEKIKHERDELEEEYVSTKLALAQTEFEKQAALKDGRELGRKVRKLRDLKDTLSERMTRMEVELAQQ